MCELKNKEYATVLARMYQNTNELTKTWGICENLGQFWHWPGRCVVLDWLDAAWRRLGVDHMFPVPYHNNYYQDNAKAFDSTRNLWTGEYGANRKHLLHLLILLAQGWEPPAEFEIVWPYPNTLDYRKEDE